MDMSYAVLRPRRGPDLPSLESQPTTGGIMLRKSSAIAAMLFLLGGLLVAPALAGVPRVVVAEEYGSIT